MSCLVAEVVVGKELTLFCSECEEEFGAAVRLTISMRKEDRKKASRFRAWKRFEKAHWNCDERSTKRVASTWEDTSKLMDRIYRDNPGIRFEEAKRLFYEVRGLAGSARPDGTKTAKI